MSDCVTYQHFEKIAYWLRQASGFDPESLGWSNFNNIIKRRMRVCLVNDIISYSSLLEQSDSEQKELIEAVVIPESWFFRDLGTFHSLKQIVANWQNCDKLPLRILSLPCAKGEEPYSIAMTLREVGLMPNQFRIDAVDISAVAIAKAMQGVYTDNAFRHKSIDFKDQYFVKISQGYKLINTIRDDVCFSVNNFFTYYSIVPYDIVFCRNLLIYFDKEMRKQSFSHLHTMLAINGMLFLGHSEAIQATHYGWNATCYPNVFCKSVSSIKY